MTTKSVRHNLASFVVILLICVPLVNGQECVENSSAVVAVVNERKITLKELDGTMAQDLYPLQEQIHELRTAALDNLISRLTIETEAQKRGISVRCVEFHALGE